MNEKSIEQKIGYYKSLVTLMWTSTLVIGSGISWSLVNLGMLKIYLISGGIIILLGLISGVLFLDRRIRRLIKEFK